MEKIARDSVQEQKQNSYPIRSYLRNSIVLYKGTEITYYVPNFGIIIISKEIIKDIIKSNEDFIYNSRKNFLFQKHAVSLLQRFFEKHADFRRQIIFLLSIQTAQESA